MSVVERIVQERKQRKEARDAVIAKATALPPEDLDEVLADLIAFVEARDGTPAPAYKPVETPRVPEPVEAPAPENGRNTYLDQAEAIVLASPNGITTSEVGKAIGQKTANADGSLRRVLQTRRSIDVHGHADRVVSPPSPS